MSRPVSSSSIVPLETWPHGATVPFHLKRQLPFPGHLKEVRSVSLLPDRAFTLSLVCRLHMSQPERP